MMASSGQRYGGRSRLQKVPFCMLRSMFNVFKMLNDNNFVKNDSLDFFS